MSLNWNSKKELRAYFSNLCEEKFSQGLAQNQEKINSRVKKFLKTKQGLWGAYRGLKFEAHVEEVFSISHLEWVFPRMSGENLEFYEGCEFEFGRYGVLEPSLSSTKRSLDEIHGILVPGLAFNRDGRRLGKGKGFYDRALRGYRGLKVGVCFEFQISPSMLPNEAHDILMDYLITEDMVYDCKNFGSIK